MNFDQQGRRKDIIIDNFLIMTDKGIGNSTSHYTHQLKQELSKEGYIPTQVRITIEVIGDKPT